MQNFSFPVKIFPARIVHWFSLNWTCNSQVDLTVAKAFITAAWVIEISGSSTTLVINRPQIEKLQYNSENLEAVCSKWKKTDTYFQVLVCLCLYRNRYIRSMQFFESITEPKVLKLETRTLNEGKDGSFNLPTDEGLVLSVTLPDPLCYYEKFIVPHPQMTKGGNIRTLIGSCSHFAHLSGHFLGARATTLFPLVFAVYFQNKNAQFCGYFFSL